MSNTILTILGFKCSGGSKSSSSIEHLSKKKDFIKIERLQFFLEVLVVFSESWSFFEARTPANYPRDPVGVLPYIACHLTQFLFVQPPSVEQSSLIQNTLHCRSENHEIG